MTGSLLSPSAPDGTTSGVFLEDSGKVRRFRQAMIPLAISGVIFIAPLGTVGAPAASASEVASAVRAAVRDAARATGGRVESTSTETEERSAASDSGSSVALSVRELKQRSGLTWGELAGAVGVSTRTVHLWANGAVISAANAERLERLSEVATLNRGNDARATRERLITPAANGGPSILSQFRTASEPEQTRKLSYFPLQEFLASEEPAGEPIVARSTRSASIKARKLRSRGAAGE